MALFQGSGVAIVTPMNKDLSVNYGKLEQLVNEQIERKTDAIIICGTTGESATLSTQEHFECIKTAASAAGGRVPVIAGCGSNHTEHAVELAQNATKAGADGLLTVTPYYNKATQKGLVEYFTTIARSSDLPMILYNVPSRTGCNILPKTAATLCKEVDTIIGLKDAAGDISQTADTACLTHGDLALYSGNDDQIIPILSLGGIGVISVLANVVPEDTHDMVMEYLSGDRHKALELQLKTLNLTHALFCEVNPIPVKTALNLMGKQVGPMRSPMCEMEPEHVETLKKALVAYGLL